MNIQKRDKPTLILVAVVISGLLAIPAATKLLSFHPAANKPVASKVQPPTATAAVTAAKPVAIKATLAEPSRPSIPPPAFHKFRQVMDEGYAVVVSPTITDEQLLRLLWLFREKVQSQHFKDIGITGPTEKAWGQKGYMRGYINVYRGEHCADEIFVTAPERDPKGCYGGNHEVAMYEWGMSKPDGPLNPGPEADYAYYVPLGKEQSVVAFDSDKDHYNDKKIKARELTDKLEADQRESIAQAMGEKLAAAGYHVRVHAHDRELAVSSDLFKLDEGRASFLQALPSVRKSLCSVGFRTVRLRGNGLFSIGDSYSIGCNR